MTGIDGVFTDASSLAHRISTIAGYRRAEAQQMISLSSSIIVAASSALAKILWLPQKARASR